MAKAVPDTILDRMLDEAEGTHIHICSGEPANFAGIAAVELGSQAIVGSITAADGDTSGRKNTYPAQSSVTIDTSGTATHIAVSNQTVSPSELRHVTTCTSTAVTNPGTADIAAYDHEIEDPT